MAWGARQHDDGSWRICERKGRTVLRVSGKEIVFKGRADCERCTKELNDLYWDAYTQARKAKAIDPAPYTGILATIHKHGGLTAADYKELLG